MQFLTLASIFSLATGSLAAALAQPAAKAMAAADPSETRAAPVWWVRTM